VSEHTHRPGSLGEYLHSQDIPGVPCRSELDVLREAADNVVKAHAVLKSPEAELMSSWEEATAMVNLTRALDELADVRAGVRT
jgi:hypothetical protein